MSSIYLAECPCRLRKKIAPSLVTLTTSARVTARAKSFCPQLTRRRAPVLSSSGLRMGEDGLTAVAAAAAPDGSWTASESKKRARDDSESADLERVAEIVMVLSAMGQMRAGREPTAAERALMAEAREKLAKTCESMELHRRKDLFTKDMAMQVVVDHGLNPPKENVPRPPKLSIAEKVANTKKKMEEAKEITAHSSPHPSQLLHVNFGVKPEGRSSLFQGAQRFLPDKVNSVPSEGFQTASLGAHAPALVSVSPSVKQSQVNEVQRGLSPLKSFSPSASASGNRLPEKTLTASMQMTTMTAVNSVQANKVQHNVVKAEGAHGIVFQSSSQLIKEHDSKTYAIQITPGNQHFVHQLAHGVNVHDPSVFNSHNEITKMVQRILPPKACDQPNWTSPSTDYINKPINCQMCKIIIRDVESLLICDACEKGAHMKCLLSYNQRIIPKAEWHCPQCLISSNGKPLPPKYGRVTRSVSVPRSSPTITGGFQASSERKVENADMKVNSYQKVITNGNPGILTRSHAAMAGSCHNEAIMDRNRREKQELDFPMTNRKIDNATQKATDTDHSDGKTGPASISPGLPDGNNQQDLNSGLIACRMLQQTSECCSQTKADSKCDIPQISEGAIDISATSQAPNYSQIINKVEVPENSNISLKHMDNGLKDPSNFRIASVHGGKCDISGENMVISHMIAGETMDRDCSGPSSTDVHNAEWVGDAVQCVESMSYYQSCRINGVIYELQNHVLICSNNDKLLPSKLQALWEDHGSRTKWAAVNHCFCPSDLPENVPRPAIPENNEVYESNNASTILLESIRGPCQVLPSNEFKKESERSCSGETNVGLSPIFLCRWLYDESKGVFRSISH